MEGHTEHIKMISERFIELMWRLRRAKTPGAKNSKELADTIGVKYSNLSMVNTGQRMPTIEMICDTCIHFNVNTEWLLLGIGPIFKSENPLPKPLPYLQKRTKKNT